MARLKKRRPAAAVWPGRAERLGRLLPRMRLHPAVLAQVAGPPRGRAPWAVALSGGADSLALLLLLWALWPERRGRLVALHFNHRLRGRAAGADEVFCRRVCAALGIEFQAGRWQTPPAGATEAQARAARFHFFADRMRHRRARLLWLGHQQDDVAETLLMRLARGSGAAGLAAPRPVQKMPGGRLHLRPLLTLGKAEVTAALRDARIPWREDASNAEARFFRNRVRRSVLPAWRRAAGERDALAGAALTRELLQEDDDALEAWLAEIAPLRADGTLDLRRLAGRPRAILRRALHRWMLAGPRGGALSRQGFNALLDAAGSGRPTRQSLGKRGFAVVRAGRLRFEAGIRPSRRSVSRRVRKST